MRMNTLPPPQPTSPTRASARPTLLWLALILVLTAALRFPALGRRGYLLDEAWTAEIATGRGSLHLALPVGAVRPPPKLFDLHNAPPWWSVWTHMQVTHPPLYFVLLRLWMDAFGQGDGIERSLSVVCSLVAAGFLFDSVRLLNGRSVAIWACLLMAVAPPQIDHARQTRNYEMELAAALAAVDALVRIKRLGVNRRRVVGLSVAVLATLLTHYFCVGFLAALAIYALRRLRGGAREAAGGAFVVAGLVFLFCWGPFMWRQRMLFSVHDLSTTFLDENDPAHVRRSLHRALLLPFDMLAPPAESVSTAATAAGRESGGSASGGGASALGQFAAVAAIVFVLPPLLLRRRPDLLLWWLCLIGTIGLVLTMDLARGTRHLAFIRYVLLAGPPVYVLIPAMAASLDHAVLRHALPATALAISLSAIGQGYPSAVTDPHRIVDDLKPVMRPGDFFVFIATGQRRWEAFAHFLVLDRYVGQFPGPIAIEDDLASPPVLRQAMAAPNTFAYTEDEDARLFLPTLAPVGVRSYVGRGEIWLMSPPPPHKR